jgi:3-methyladenine DNA glycosylase AlkC
MSARGRRTLFDLTQDGLVIGQKLQRIYPEFDTSAFVVDVRTEMEGQTIYNVTKAIGRVWRHHLPESYSDALELLMNFVDAETGSKQGQVSTAEVEASLRPVSHFVSLYGQADFDASLDAFYKLAKYRCARGGEIREFIIEQPERCFERLRESVKDENPHLRLFVCASLCTRGTWQKWLRPFIPDPQPMLALLETLKDDPDARVREQVATDMRDIVKDYPEEGYATLERWSQDGWAETEKILRQALKYQVKLGDKRALKQLGLGALPKFGKAQIVLIELKPEREVVAIHDAFRFSFSLQSESDEPQTILTYYAISYKRSTGHITRKRYRLSQRKLKPRQRVDYEKSLFPLPSLKQYHDGKACLGWHRFELEVNGAVFGDFDFEATAPEERESD